MAFLVHEDNFLLCSDGLLASYRPQNITLDRAIVDIGKNEFQVGLTYVAMSRVRTLDGWLIKPSFNIDRLININNSTSMIARRNEIRRLFRIS